MRTRLPEPGELDQLDKTDLAKLWNRVTNLPLPRVSLGLLRLSLVYQLQAKANGSLPVRTRKRLMAMTRGTAQTEALRPGTRLVREWQGKVEVITISDAGEIVWNDKEWRSLSEVARAITGTRWSGPAFFGLKKKARVQ